MAVPCSWRQCSPLNVVFEYYILIKATNKRTQNNSVNTSNRTQLKGATPTSPLGQLLKQTTPVAQPRPQTTPKPANKELPQATENPLPTGDSHITHNNPEQSTTSFINVTNVDTPNVSLQSLQAITEPITHSTMDEGINLTAALDLFRDNADSALTEEKSPTTSHSTITSDINHWRNSFLTIPTPE